MKHISKLVLSAFALLAVSTASAQETTTQVPAATPAPAPAEAAPATPSDDKAQGLIFVEPGLALTFGSETTGEIENVDDTSGKANGFGLLGRAGFHVREVFLLGLDARYSWLKFEDSGLNGSADAAAFNYGPFVGLQMPNYGLRIWGTYVIDGTLDPKAINTNLGNVDAKASDANGYRVGAGLRLQAFSVNLEYQNLKYGQVEKQGGILPGTWDAVKLKDESWIASVSFPLEL